MRYTLLITPVNATLCEMIRMPYDCGDYLIARPDEVAGESTVWYASFWDFCAVYLRQRFGTNYCLSLGQSLLLHMGISIQTWTVTAAWADLS